MSWILTNEEKEWEYHSKVRYKLNEDILKSDNDDIFKVQTWFFLSFKENDFLFCLC